MLPWASGMAGSEGPQQSKREVQSSGINEKGSEAGRRANEVERRKKGEGRSMREEGECRNIPC